MGDEKIRLTMFPIHIEQLRFTPNGRSVLAGVDLTLGGEGISVILGPNGSGKSVLIRMLAGLERPDGGIITWQGNSAPVGQIAIVFQHPMLLRSSVAANVALGLKPMGLSRNQVSAKAMRISDDIVFIEAGRVREHTPSARFFSRPQSHEARLFMKGELPWRISFDD